MPKARSFFGIFRAAAHQLALMGPVYLEREKSGTGGGLAPSSPIPSAEAHRRERAGEARFNDRSRHRVLRQPLGGVHFLDEQM